MTDKEQKLEERLDKIEGMVTVLWRTVGTLQTDNKANELQIKSLVRKLRRQSIGANSNGL